MQNTFVGAIKALHVNNIRDKYSFFEQMPNKFIYPP
jgi:hypothetical protein